MLALLALLAAPLAAAGQGDALAWLKAGQAADGSLGAWPPLHTPAAALALWEANASSTNSTAALAWLVADLNNPTSFTWFEADTAGLELWAVASAGGTAQLNSSAVAGRFSSLRGQSGGYVGYWDAAAGASVESSVDTAASLMGLSSAGLIDNTNKSAAVAYLLLLQNADGSFNLTNTIAYDPLYSIGPDRTGLTAFVLLGLSGAGLLASNSSAAAGLGYLRSSALTCYGNSNRSYAAALASLAFAAFNDTAYSSSAAAYLLSLQKLDGGFADSSRGNPNASNALDTGFAALALQSANSTAYPACAPGQVPTLSVDSPVTNGTPAMIRVSASGAVSGVSANVTYPSNSTTSLQLQLNATSGLYERFFAATSELGTYLVAAAVFYIGGNITFLNATFTSAAASPTPTPAPTAQPPAPRPDSFVAVAISYPAGSGLADAHTQVLLSACPSAHLCFSQVAPIECQWFTASGALACPGISQTCFVQKVGGVAAPPGGGWSFYANGQPASTGVSCYKPAAGDAIELRLFAYSTAPAPTAAPAAAAPAATPAPSAAPAQAEADQQAGGLEETAGGEAAIDWRISGSSGVHAEFAPRSTALTLSYTATEPFEGSLRWRLPLEYGKYLAGMVSFDPVPERVEAGSIIAVWSGVKLAAGESFNASVRLFERMNATLLQDFEPPRAEPLPAASGPQAGGTPTGGAPVVPSQAGSVEWLWPAMAAVLLAAGVLLLARLRRAERFLKRERVR